MVVRDQPIARPALAAWERDLLDRIGRGDTDAYGELVRRTEPRLRRLVRGIVADAHLAEDVLQDVYLVAYQNLPGFRGESPLGAWLYRIAVREAVRARSRWQKIWRLVAPLDESGVASQAGRPPGATAEVENLLAVLARLPTQERAALVLHAVDGRTYDEIAELLGSNSGTVGSWIHRARKRINSLTQPSAGECEVERHGTKSVVLGG